MKSEHITLTNLNSTTIQTNRIKCHGTNHLLYTFIYNITDPKILNEQEGYNFQTEEVG